MPEAIYALCALTSIACAVFLTRSWLRGRERLLVWSAICFGALALNNCVLFVDLVVFEDSISLLPWRNAAALVGVSSLLAGLIWETT